MVVVEVLSIREDAIDVVYSLTWLDINSFLSDIINSLITFIFKKIIHKGWYAILHQANIS